MKRPFAIHFAAAIVFAATVAFAQTESKTNDLRSTPPGWLMLDESRWIRETLVSEKRTNSNFKGVVGTRMFDGLPFRIKGRGWLYGKREADAENKPREVFHDFIGIPANAIFDEIHLLHGSRWQTAIGEPIAKLRLNYTDGTSNEFQIAYGVHVRDWLRMHSEESESLADTNSKIVWRYTPATNSLKATVRLFKTKFDNPHPEKPVATLDFISTGSEAAYDLIAVTLARADRTRPVSPPADDGDGDRRFSRTTTVWVFDQSGKPLAGVFLNPGYEVNETHVIGQPVYTGTNGAAAIHYPGMKTKSLSIQISTNGYMPSYLYWSAKRYGNNWWQKAIEDISLMKSFIPETNDVTLILSNAPVPLIGLPAK